MEPVLDASHLEAGVDEAGRGCLAGPVVAAAVVWDPDPAAAANADPEYARLVRDSKSLTRDQRRRVRSFIEEHALAFSVAFVEADEIDRVNILNATYDAMHKALDGLGLQVTSIVVDGDRFRPYADACSAEFVPHRCIVDGDKKYRNIAAASVLAKTYRDEFVMTRMHPEFPRYGWDRNMCYGTAEHLLAIRELGVTPYHRKTFGPVKCDFIE